MKLTPKTIAIQVQRHDNEWDTERSVLRQYRHAYETRYWAAGNDPGTLTIETSRAYEYIEGYIASLFNRNPGVVVKPDPRGRGDAGKAQAIVNSWLVGIRRELEDASRNALIFPSAALKLAPRPHADPYQRVDVSTVLPWDLILDRDAGTWDRQRYIGHRYWVPLDEAKARWGAKEYEPVARKEWIDQDQRGEQGNPDDDFDKFIQVVEVYDLIGDRLLVWSEQYANGEKWLYDGIEIEDADGNTTKIRRIPFRDADDHPVIPIAPLYYNRLPYEPLKGYSAMARVYDQVREYNILRTFQAAAVRKAARQWFTRSNALTPEGMARIVAGVDGEFIEVDLPPGQSMADVVYPVPHTPTPPETYQYLEAVQSDFERGSVLAPFTRGDATKATATEITALAAYSSSEVGRLARERDAVIEAVAEVYIAMVRMYLSEDKPDLVVLDGKIQAVTADDLTADFSYFAQDSGSTPVSEAAKKQELVQAMPLLLQLGVPKEKVLAELVRQFNLPEDFIAPPPPPPPPPPPSASTAPMPPGQEIPPEAVGGSLGIGPGELPSPEQVRQVLPPGGVV